MKVTFTINDKPVEARSGWTVLDTTRHYGIDIPTLCHHGAVTPSGACRLCMVELRQGDWSKLVASCIYPAQEGLCIYTDTPRVDNVRKWIFEMLLSYCPASGEIRDMAARYGVTTTRFTSEDPERTCMVCGLCARVCEEVVGLSAIAVVDRGVHKKVGSPYFKPTDVCVACGCCVSICPTSAMQSIFDSVRGEPSGRMAQLAG